MRQQCPKNRTPQRSGPQRGRQETSKASPSTPSDTLSEGTTLKHSNGSDRTVLSALLMPATQTPARNRWDREDVVVVEARNHGPVTGEHSLPIQAMEQASCEASYFGSSASPSRSSSSSPCSIADPAFETDEQRRQCIRRRPLNPGAGDFAPEASC